MTEIWNLSTLCRCCHSDGCYKKLNLPYQSENGVEIYEIMLQDSFGITIKRPPVDHASYTICDLCIRRLQDASRFKQQVLLCEQKFNVYCSNEQFPSVDISLDIVKTEVEYSEPENDINLDVDDQDIPRNDNNVQRDDENLNLVTIKKEGMIEVHVAPIQQNDGKDKENIKTESEDKKKPIKVKKIIKKKKSGEIIKQSALNNHNYLKGRRKILDTYIKKEKTINFGLTYSCKICHVTYKTKEEIYKHVKNEHQGRFKCEQCGKAFKHEAYLHKHIKIIHTAESQENNEYPCSECDKKYDCKAKLKAHENTHSQIYKCDICHKELRYKSTLRKHILLHTGENKAVLCDICGWSFNQRCNLEAHIRAVHLKMRPYSCSICGKTYTAKKHVKSHMKSAHSGNPKPLQCDYCSKSFACPKSLKIHKLTHENHFTCRYCPEVFTNKKDIDDHRKTHTQKHLLSSSFACHLCSKVLMSRFTLNRHLEVHSGIRRFSCDVCGLKFTQKTLLQRHQLRKHDPSVKTEKVKCDLCKKFVRDLDKHMDIHDADKRKFFCDMCGKNYPTNNALTRHKDQKHYGVSYDCEICGKKYIKKGSLHSHKFKIHKIKKEIDTSNL